MNIKTLRLLLDNGADATIRAKNGDTALSIAEDNNRRALEEDAIRTVAEEYCHEEIVLLLKEAPSIQSHAARTAAHAVAAERQDRLKMLRPKAILIRRLQA